MYSRHRHQLSRIPGGNNIFDAASKRWSSVVVRRTTADQIKPSDAPVTEPQIKPCLFSILSTEAATAGRDISVVSGDQSAAGSATQPLNAAREKHLLNACRREGVHADTDVHPCENEKLVTAPALEAYAGSLKHVYSPFVGVAFVAWLLRWLRLHCNAATNARTFPAGTIKN